MLEVMSVDLGIPAIHLSKYKILPEVVKSIPKKIAQLYCVMPVSVFGKTLTVAMSDPTSMNALDDLRGMTGLEIRLLLASDKDIRDTIGVYYGDKVESTVASSEVPAAVPVPARSAEEIASDALAAESASLIENEPVVKLTNSLLTESLRLHASDILIEPEEKEFKVRYRIDGILEEGKGASREMHLGVVSRIKVMSNLDIAEHRIPQDGRFKIETPSGIVDFRVSVLPTFFGEKVVLRVLDKHQSVLDVDQLGFEPEPLKSLKDAAGHPYGMILICGPTGSGKTTTLYAILKHIDRPEKNLVTVEDPVEYQMEGINQVSVRPDIHLTFAAALRSILRQDPNIIMVGEMRDTETGDIAVKSALTGHLVLSTLHSTTAAGAVTRLLNMGIEPFLLTSSVLLAGSQRLVRKVCSRCREEYEPTKELLDQLGITDEMLQGKRPVFCRPKGCEACLNKGYAGRVVLLEALAITNPMKSLILKGAQEYELKALGRREGMKTLRENGISKVLQKITTPEEVIRATLKD
jgi:type IV pilus assembly protein PilB